MSRVTYFVFQPFTVGKRGKPIASTPQQFKSERQATARAERYAAAGGSAVVYSRTGDPAIGEFDDAVVVGRYGNVPEEVAA